MKQRTKKEIHFIVEEETHYCEWPGGPGCEKFYVGQTCCGATGWREISHIVKRPR